MSICIFCSLSVKDEYGDGCKGALAVAVVDYRYKLYHHKTKYGLLQCHWIDYASWNHYE